MIGTRPGGDPVKRYQSYTPLPETGGDVAAMSMWAGQGVAQVRGIKPAGVIVAEIHAEACALIAARAAAYGP